jgi:hypothetical protein
MKNKCVEIGLDRCPRCGEGSEMLYMTWKCWVETYEETINNLKTNDELKEYFLKEMLGAEDWEYYFSQTVYRLFPERAHVIEKIMVLK